MFAQLPTSQCEQQGPEGKTENNSEHFTNVGETTISYFEKKKIHTKIHPRNSLLIQKYIQGTTIWYLAIQAKTGVYLFHYFLHLHVPGIRHGTNATVESLQSSDAKDNKSLGLEGKRAM